MKVPAWPAGGRDVRPSHAAAASTTQTGPRANVMTWPDMVVNVVPP
jgi:hypothetical protein